ncbi:hypothetical protein BGP77_07265 [Saccharospirillum sp. MSK14-1]|nr:hypothetical protein BGP77_07265 [Saccharospirillum sp. MSK14-1]
MSTYLPIAIVAVLGLYYLLRNRSPALAILVMVAAIGVTTVYIMISSGQFQRLLNPDSILPVSTRLIMLGTLVLALTGLAYVVKYFYGSLQAERTLKQADSETFGTLVAMNYSRISVNRMRLVDAQIDYLGRTQWFRGLPASFGLNAMIGDRVIVRYHSAQPDKAAVDLDRPIMRG